MKCPHCQSTRVSPLQRQTSLGYGLFRCKPCRRTFHERTDTPFNFIEVPTDILFQVMLCRVRYKLSYRDMAEFFLLRGFQFTHKTVRFWGLGVNGTKNNAKAEILMGHGFQPKLFSFL